MRKNGWRNQIGLFLYDHQIGNGKIGQIKKSFREVSGILQGEQKKSKKK